ncbi:anti-sigma factor [Tsuneonella sp. HG222]
MMSERVPLTPEQSALAAEFALGLLDGAERSEARRLLLANPGFAREVRAWQERIDDWHDDLEEQEPPAGMFDRIEGEIGDFHLRPARATAVDRTSAWKRTAFAAMAASLALTIALGFTMASVRQVEPPRDNYETQIVSQISGVDGAPLLSAVFDPQSTTLRLRIDTSAPEGKLPELWIIPEGQAPHSLGLLSEDRMTIEISPEVRALLNEQATLAITIEDIAGAPHAAPTGSIIGTAKLQSL